MCEKADRRGLSEYVEEQRKMASSERAVRRGGVRCPGERTEQYDVGGTLLYHPARLHGFWKCRCGKAIVPPGDYS